MYSPEFSVKTYLTISLMFAASLIASVVIIGSPVFNWIFGMIAISTAFMAIAQSMLNQKRA
ncbi:hypothetical protein [Corynebacterium stationis]|uniref:hypothetical protein n=1 Tax=Corynebacterium stationis TaxID=1705 RepID=UPI0024B197A4|nr:hypothetical protein [Corynebacterium stationis]